MAWKKPSLELTVYLEDKLSAFECQKRTMFGCPSYFVNGNMMAGVFQEDIFIRLSEADRKDISLSSDEVAPFEPIKGRKLKEYVVLPDSIYNDLDKFGIWLERSYNYVSSVPAKNPKKR